MTGAKNLIAEVSDLCRRYPRSLTSAELVGSVFLLLAKIPGKQQVHWLKENLAKQNLLKLQGASTELDDSLAGAESFNLGAVRCPGGIDIDDRLIPADFVRELKRSFKQSKSVG